MFSSRTSLLILFIVCSAAALGAGYFAAQWKRAPSTAVAPMAPAEIVLADPQGAVHAMDEFPATLYLVNFWATWCAPCREEMPLLAAMHEEYVDEGLQVIGIAIDDVEAVRRFRDELGIDYPLLMAQAEGMALMERLGNDRGALPYTVFLAADGTVRETRLGILRADELLVLIRTHL